MKLKRFNIDGSPVVAAEYESRWIPLDSLSGFAIDRIGTLTNTIVG